MVLLGGCVGEVASSPALPFLSERRVQPDALSLTLSTNPARPHRQTSFANLRQPTTVVEFLEREDEGGYRLRERLRRQGYSFQNLSQGVALGEETHLTGHLLFRQEGRFTRVNEEGTSIHAFPETDWLLGASLSQRIGKRFFVGAGASWWRSKRTVSEERTRYAHGWLFDGGVFGALAPTWEIGIVARNFGRGISLPAKPRRELLFGVTGKYPLRENTSLEWAVDVRTPSKRGLQGSGGVALLFAERFGIAVGCQRFVEELRSLAENGSDQREWVSEGLTVGGSARLGGWVVGVRARPSFLPRAAERRDVRQGRQQWNLTLSSFEGKWGKNAVEKR